MTAKRITERVNADVFAGTTGDQIDAAAGIVRNVGICGLVSENGRDYPLPVLQRDHGKYDGAKVFFDHTDEKSGRRFRDWVGVVRETSCVASGSRGRLELFTTDPNVPKLLEALRKCPEKFGMSHVAFCKTKSEGGREVVESIESVESVDIVLNPATNPNGFFRRESKGDAVQISLKKFGERFGPKWGAKKWGAFEKLCEELGDMADAPVMDDPPADMADGDLKDALMAALSPMLMKAFESGDSGPAERALRDFVKLHAKHTGGGSTDSTDTTDTTSTDTEEGRKVDLAAVLKECSDKGVTPTGAQLVALAGVPTAAARALVIESIKATTEGAGRETPKSGTPRAGQKTERAPEKKQESAANTPEQFARRYRS